MLGRLNITQKLAAAVVAPLVALGGLSFVGFGTFNRVKVNGPEYQKLATTADLVADVLPPPAYFLELQYVAQGMLRSSFAEFQILEKRSQGLQKSFEERHKYWNANLDTIGEPALVEPFLKDSNQSAQEYFTVFNDEYVPALRAAYARGWDPAEVQVVINEPAVKAERIFETKLTPLYDAHRAAIDKTVQVANAKRSTLESDVRSTVSQRLYGLGFIALAGALGTFLLSAFVARAIRRPIKQLTDAANRAATEDLPLMVAAAQAGEAPPKLQRNLVEVQSNDEIADLAAAFASMQGTAVGLAREQALIRRNVGENLVNLARRNQGLLGRSLSVLSTLEQDERDPDKLQDLFKVDHLTTRMRRNAESLLVLAGAEPNRKWAAGVEVGDVVRAAVSAIESFDRVDIIGLDDVKVRGAAVNDVAHLLAELIENATNFSPPESRVTVVGKARTDGYLIVVSDNGIGMSADDLAVANARISEASTFESTPTKVLGLNVVGRLAHRYGIDVKLAASTTSGIAARIQVPSALLEVSDGTADSALPTVTNDAVHGSDFGVGDSAPAAPALQSELAHVAVEEQSTETPDWLQNVTGVSMESDSTDLVVREPSAEQAELAAMTTAMTEETTADRPDNVRELRPQTEKRKGLTRRVKGANADKIAPVVEAVEAPVDPDRAGTVMTSLSNLQKGLNRGRSLHPSEVPLDPTPQEPVFESATTEVATDGVVHQQPDQQTDQVAEQQTEPQPNPVEYNAAPVSETPAALTKRVKGAQMVDTGPEPTAWSDNVESDVADAERAEAVKRSLTGLQRGLERGRALDDQSHQDGPVDVAPVETAPVEPAIVESAAIVSSIEHGAAAETSALDAASEPPAASGSLRRRVKGAQMPVTDLPTPASPTVSADPNAVRSALGSLQRGVSSARLEIEADGNTPESTAESVSGPEHSTQSAPAPTH